MTVISTPGQNTHVNAVTILFLSACLAGTRFRPRKKTFRHGAGRRAEGWRHGRLARASPRTGRAQGFGLVARRRSMHRNAPRATTVSTIVAAAKKNGAARVPM